MGKRGPRPVHISLRFWDKVHKTDTCWLWTARVSTTGYGAIGAGGMNNGWRKAHRVAWILTNGPIPDDLLVLHRCNVRTCVNPDHLYLGNAQDNMDDKSRATTHCKNGHAYTPDNLYRNGRNGRKACRICVTVNRLLRRTNKLRETTADEAIV